MSESIWETLGIFATTDRTAIHRAYAVRLKAIDVDADPDAFILLRAAFEQARAHADGERVQVEPEMAAATVVIEASAIGTDGAWLGGSLGQEARALEALLHGDRPRAEIHEEVRAQTRLLIERGDAAEVGQRAELERWIAGMIVRAHPRSDAMIMPSIHAFRWIEQAGLWDCPPAIRMIANRYRDRDLGFLERLLKPDTKYRRAYVLLRTEAPARLGFRADLQLYGEVRDLLSKLDIEYPVLLVDFDPRALARWQSLIARNKGRIARWHLHKEEGCAKALLVPAGFLAACVLIMLIYGFIATM